MPRLLWLSALSAFLSLGCGGPPPTPFRPIADVKQLMASIMEPSAEVYWDAVGTIIDANGAVDFAPATTEEWDAVVNAAYTVAESGNLLMMTSRAKDEGDWMKYCRALIEAGQKAIRAAEARDRTAVFDVGAEVYDACTNCHAQYAVETLRPSAR